MNDAQALVLAELSVGDYAPIRSAYKMEIAGAVMEYLLTDKAKITKFRNAFKRAITDNFQAAFYQGYTDGGGDPKEAAPEDEAWLTAKINAEFGHVDMLFQQLKEFKADPDTQVSDYQAEAEKRAEGYARTLDGVYSEGKVRGSKDIMLTFGGNDGEESCKTCQRLQGQTHKKSWWVRRGLVPTRGNMNYDCGVFNCQHFLYDNKGNIYTV